MLCHLNEVKASFTVCLFQFMLVYEIKGEHSISQASYQVHFVSLVACTVGRLNGPREAYMYTDVTDHLLNK